MKSEKVKTLFDFLPKSKIKAGEGKAIGNYPFYTSSENLTKYIDSYLYEPECLVFGTGGKPSVHLATEYFATSTDCIVMQPKQNGELSASFAYLYLKSNMQILEKGFKGAGLKHISKKYISNISIPVPSSDEQKRISELLCKIEKLISTRKQDISQLDEFLRSVFLEMFGDIKAKKSIHNWKKPRPYLKANSGKSSKEVKSSEPTNFPIYGGNGVNGWANKPLYNEPIVIAGRVGQQCGIIHVSKGPCWVTDNAIAIKIIDKNKLNSTYLATAFQEAPIREKVKQLDLPFINQSMLLDYSIPIPPLSLQDKYASIVQKIEKIKNIYQLNLSGIENLYGALSQKVFKGELDLLKIQQVDITSKNLKEKTELRKPDLTEAESSPIMFSLSKDVKITKNSFVEVDLFQEEINRQARFSEKALANLFQKASKPLSFLEIMKMIENKKFAGDSDYDTVCNALFKLLDKGIIKQSFDIDENRIRLCHEENIEA